MFHTISDAIIERMRSLEAIDARDREDGTPHLKRLRQIPAETGRFLSIMAASAPSGEIIEIGTSAGYSTLWLALACQETGREMKTFELLNDKIALATDTFDKTAVNDVVQLIHGDARDYIDGLESIAFCFLDAEKNIYQDCYDLVVPRMTTGGFLIADNAINHYQALQPMLNRALTDRRVDAAIIPIGKGVLLCRKI